MKAFVLAAVGLVAACTAPDATAQRDPAVESQPIPPADPLLAEARRNIRDGELPAGVVELLQASNDPRHLRAKVLLGLAERPPEVAQAPDEPVKWEAPSLVLATSSAPGDSAAAKRRAVAPVPTATAAPANAERESASRARSRGLADLGLKRTRAGAKLSLRGGSDLSFTVVRQPERNLVRLVVETADVAEPLLRSRPQLGGVRVVDVRQVQRSVFITVQLADAWTLGATRRSRHGTSLEFLAPPE